MLKSHQSNWNVSDRSIFFLLLEEKYWHNNFFVDRFVGAVQENNRTFLVCYGNGISFETFWSLRTNCALQFRDMCKYCGKFTSDTGDSAHDAVSSGEGGGPRDFHRHTSFTLAEIQFVKKRANGRICILQVTKCSTGCAINAVNQDYIPSLKAEHYGTQQWRNEKWSQIEVDLSFGHSGGSRFVDRMTMWLKRGDRKVASSWWITGLWSEKKKMAALLGSKTSSSGTVGEQFRRSK